ncbi:MAG TPA: alpha-amylase family glycosyl hydrolase [Acidimicrobiales bacterium]|nr:alpha-amylase family glycosyl hydrolase [Acidimicrobiales bacterium]
MDSTEPCSREPCSREPCPREPCPREPWWSGATIYQIYVRSWRDSNGDGIGDLPGVIEGLDYLQWTGVDAIWLSPTMPSPNTDYGYDVSDYFGVHPELGTLDDLDRLVSEARQRDIAVMLDMVPNHSSDQHPWFLDARSAEDSPHRDYYVWAAPRDGGPPNNWVDATGKEAWTLDEASNQYYLHNFLPTQPDLNWWDDRVHSEFEHILNFWLGRGIAGFRIDVAHGLYKDAQLRDDPAPGPDDHPAVQARRRKQVYSSHRPEVHGLYRRWRQIADGYSPQRALLGETWEFDIQKFGDFYGRTAPELHMAFNFTFVMSPFRARDLSEIVEGTLAALPPGATAVWTASNHDVGRFPSRWCGNDDRATKAALVMLATLPGTLVLYYGDELGMTDVEVPPGRQRDEMSIAQPNRPSRDRCRTPMQWSNDANAGFTTPGTEPWLPLGDYSSTNVATQRAGPASVLSLWRQLSQLRRQGLIGAVSALEHLHLDDNLWAYRVGNALSVLNLHDVNATYEVPGASRLLLRTQASTYDLQASTGDFEGELRLGPWEAAVLAITP